MSKLKCNICGTPVETDRSPKAITCSLCVARGFNPPEGTAERASTGSERKTVSKYCSNFIHGKHQGDRQCSILAGRECSFFDRVVLASIPKSERGAKA